MPRRETVVKTICRPLRQLQVLDLARVHSIFPTDVIALIPNSYLMKHRKHRQHSEAQTEECQLLNIYDMYKNEEKAAVSVSANKNCH